MAARSARFTVNRPYMKRALSCLMVLLSSLAADCPAATDLIFRSPTANEELFRGDDEGFYMYCDRFFEGKKTKPWEAGSYGMVRNPFRASDGTVMYSRLHEGIDVKPLRRDANNEPLDEVFPVAPGTVAYVSSRPGNSNYGRYVVVAHELPEGTIYSLYAHLRSVSCEAGQFVGTGNQLGVLGYSGVGLNKVRAHCHLELCLMVNSGYGAQKQPPSNLHGNFNGINLIGFNPTDVLMFCKDGTPFSLKAYFDTLQEHYRVRVPYYGTLDILQRHPFLYKGPRTNEAPPSWDISFTAEGIPIGIYPGAEPVEAPVVIKCKPLPTYQQNCTANRVKGSSKTAQLTSNGRRFIEHFLWLEGIYPSPPPEPEETPVTEQEEQPSDT